MRRTLRRLGLIVAAAMLLVVPGATAALAGPARSEDDPRLRLRLSSHGETVRATPGSGCSVFENPNGGGVGECETAAYPLNTRGALTVHRGGVVIARVGARATSLVAELRRYDGRPAFIGVKRVGRLDETGRRWRIQLPSDLKNARTLGVFADYRDGDRDFEAALEMHRHGASGCSISSRGGSRQSACVRQR
jgi:hypothetical protein